MTAWEDSAEKDFREDVVCICPECGQRATGATVQYAEKGWGDPYLPGSDFRFIAPQKARYRLRPCGHTPDQIKINVGDPPPATGVTIT